MNEQSRTTRIRRGPIEEQHVGTVAILMTDVEPAVRLNAELEAQGIRTVTISPMDDVRGDLRRAHPDVLVLTGALLDGANVSLVRQQLWEGVPVVGFTDVSDAGVNERLRDVGYVETWPKPIVLEEVVDGIRRQLDRQRLALLT